MAAGVSTSVRVPAQTAPPIAIMQMAMRRRVYNKRCVFPIFLLSACGLVEVGLQLVVGSNEGEEFDGLGEVNTDAATAEADEDDADNGNA